MSIPSGFWAAFIRRASSGLKRGATAKDPCCPWWGVNYYPSLGFRPSELLNFAVHPISPSSCRMAGQVCRPAQLIIYQKARVALAVTTPCPLLREVGNWWFAPDWTGGKEGGRGWLL